jgi:hypothetical protein
MYACYGPFIHSSLSHNLSQTLFSSVFHIEQGYPVMTAAKNVEDSLAKHNLPASDDFYLLLATEELVRLDRTYKLAWLANNGGRISRERVDGKAPEVRLNEYYRWRIACFHDAYEPCIAV